MENVIIYGMSGTLKATTIKSRYSSYFKVLSETKPYFNIDKRYFNWSARSNNAHICSCRLMILSNYLPTNRDIVCERGVTDFIFGLPNSNISGMDSYDLIDINGLSELESNLLCNSNNSPIRKVLLVMKDEDFIINEVLSGKDSYYRKRLYPDLDTYIKKQDEYIDFTCKHNLINEVVPILNARDYIENELNLSYYGK